MQRNVYERTDKIINIEIVWMGTTKTTQDNMREQSDTARHAHFVYVFPYGGYSNDDDT